MVKKIIIFASLILFSIGLNCFAEEVGRYQLIQGEYSFVNIKGERYQINGLFKIDTATGRVWVADGYQYKDLKSGNVWQVGGWKEFEGEFQVSASTQD